MKQKLTFSAILLLALAIPQSVFAYDFSAVSPSGHTLYYIVNGNNVTLTYPGSNVSYPSPYTRPTGALVIPSTVINNSTTYTVTAIGSLAFNLCTGLTSVTLPATITSIGQNAFSQCSGLTSITIPNAVTNIASQAFYNCSNLSSVIFNADSCINTSSLIFGGSTRLTNVTIGNTVKVIPNYLFSNCSTLTSITIPNSVERIGQGAFYSCTGLSSVQIPSAVMYIGNNAFYRVKNIVYYGSASGSPWGANTRNGFVDGDFVYSDASKSVLTAYYGTDTIITISNTVSTIGDYAFWDNTNLVSVSLPNNVISIGNYAFYGCRNLSVITFPSSLGMIGNSAFCRCASLHSINIPSSIYSLGNGAFSLCTSLETVYFGTSLSTVSQEAFSDCWSLRYVSLPPYLSSIGDGAFRNCYKLASLTVPNNVSTIGMQAFEYVRNIIYNGTAGEDCYWDLCYWGARCRNGYLFDSVYYRDSTMRELMSVHPDAKSIVISDSTQWINNFAFYHCDVKSIIIPLSVTSIGDQVFDSCFYLRNIQCDRQIPPSWNGVMFFDPYMNNYDSIVLHVPCGSLLDYAHRWYCFSNIIEPSASYTMTVSSTDTTMGMTSTLLSPNCSSNQAVIIAHPNNGYYFSAWGDGSTDNPRYLIVNSDTSIVAVFSSVPPAPDTVHVHDTTLLIDTLTVTDTLFLTDTINTRDTIYLPVYLHDTLLIEVHDTIIIHDTIYITGVDNAEPLEAKIYTHNGHIIVEGTQGYPVTLYDAVGRLLVTKETLPTGNTCELPVTTTGVYLVKIGSYPARRVVIRR